MAFKDFPALIGKSLLTEVPIHEDEGMPIDTESIYELKVNQYRIVVEFLGEDAQGLPDYRYSIFWHYSDIYSSQQFANAEMAVAAARIHLEIIWRETHA